jgi:hypothetical protein
MGLGFAKDIELHYSDILKPIVVAYFLKILFAHNQMVHV